MELSSSDGKDGEKGTAENPEMSGWIEDEEEELGKTLPKYSYHNGQAELGTHIERLSKDWTAPIYAFFKPNPLIEYVEGRRCHAFQCLAKNCKQKSRTVRRYLDTGDAKSTGNMRKHAKKCWGDEVVAAADKAKTAKEVRDTTIKGYLDPQSITAAFERKGKGKVTYSYRQHTKTELKAEIVRWVSESMRPFDIVEDRGFQCLMKTGRPEFYIPSRTTVSRDAKQVFVNARKRIAMILKVSILANSITKKPANVPLGA